MQSESSASGAQVSGEPQRYMPIGTYGAIGDCRTAALVAPTGSIDWLCMPHFDSPAILCKLLDADRGGYFQICPAETSNAAMAYQPETNILETSFTTGSGRLRLVDYMPIRTRRRSANPLRRLAARLSQPSSGLAAGLEREVGNDVAAAHRVNRVAMCLEGEVRVALTLKVTFDYARRPAHLTEQVKNEYGVGAILSDGQRFVVLVVRSFGERAVDAGSLELLREEDVLRLSVPLVAGQGLVAALNYARSEAEARGILSRLFRHRFEKDLHETHAYWQGWAAKCVYTGAYQDAVRRSALTLKLCTFEPTGAIVASPTTSLPEDVGGVRNWDYRYTWLRDSSFTLGALGRLGYFDEARDYFHFLHDLQIKNGDDLRIMYSIRGQTDGDLREIDLTHLEGYGGSRPVRIGNGAATQRQMDVYGELLDAAYTYITHAAYKSERRPGPNRDLRHFASLMADYVAEHWRELDQGIWEVRGQPRAFVYSRAMCWVALDRACRLSSLHKNTVRARRWCEAADQIHADVLANGYDRQLETFIQAYGPSATLALDAANLRVPLAEFVSWDSPEAQGTLRATMRALAAPKGLIFRYRGINAQGEPVQDMADDGLPGGEGAFLACAFWLIEALCWSGAVEEARERFEQLLSFAGPLGLFSEEVDPTTGALLGNYPQAYTHIGLINSAVILQRAQQGTLTANGGVAAAG